MNFVTTEDFNIVPFAFPEIAKSKAAFDKYVTTLQEKELREVFGSYFYDTFTEALDALPPVYVTKTAYAIGDQVVYGNDVFEALAIVPITNVDVPVDGAVWSLIEADNRWLLLKNGAKYTYYDKPYKWKGMQETIKGLVYAYWPRDKYNDTLTTVGNAQSAAENSIIVAMAQRQVRAFNQYVEYLSGSNYRPFDSYNYLYTNCDTFHNTMYGYLWSNEEAFADLFVDQYWTGLRNYLTSEFKAPRKWNIFNL